MTANAKGSVDPNVTRNVILNSNAFPCTIPTLRLGLNDVGFQQKVLANSLNYVAASSCEVFDVREDGICKWLSLRSEGEFRNHLTCPGLDSITSDRETAVSTRIIFVALTAAEGATFGGQISLSHFMTDLLFQSFSIRPEFIPLMFGQFGGNHLPPGHFQHHDRGGELINLARANAVDPFLLPTIISHECFMQSDSSVFDLGSRLYSALDSVDKVNETQYNRQELESVTFNLHQVSQDADSLIQSSDIAISIMERMREAQEILQQPPKAQAHQKQNLQPSIDATTHLTHAIHARRRWLTSAKSRKDTTMTLLYALVAQKEAATSIAIARDTKADSSSMKAIAALTMAFLPAMAVTSFFGMGFFDSNGGKFSVASEVWVFVAISVPLTVATVVVWWIWDFWAVQRSPATAVSMQAGSLLVRGVLGKLMPGSVTGRRIKMKEKEVV